MQVGILLVFQNYRGQTSDSAVIQSETRIAELAEPLGFDKLWSVEHHFTDYAACPDNLQFLSYIAARTSRIQLATGAVIVPWNDPLRVAEKISLLDHLSGGRAVLGLGRGLARREYEIMSEHFKDARGYEHYATASDLFKQVGLQIAADTYCSVQTWGTPKMILEKLRWRRELIGDFELNTIVNYGGLPFDEAEKSIRLFANQVLPEVQSW